MFERRGGGGDEDNYYERWLRVTNTTFVGDADATQQIRALVEVSAKVKSQPTQVTPKKPKVGRKKMVDEEDEDGDDESDPGRPKTNANLVLDLREKTHCLRHLGKELVGRVRSLRHSEGVRDLQKSKVVLPISLLY